MELQLEGRYWFRPTQRFYGLGNETSRFDRSIYLDEACELGCGAKGTHRYGLTGGASPASSYPEGLASECTQVLEDGGRTGAFCCQSLICTRDRSWDSKCPGSHPAGYHCEGPDAPSRPTRPTCQIYIGPGNELQTHYCCEN